MNFCHLIIKQIHYFHVYDLSHIVTLVPSNINGSPVATTKKSHLLRWDAGRHLPVSAELTLDQLLAAPIVQQLMRRDGIDAKTIRHLLRKAHFARMSPPTPLAEDDPEVNIWLLQDIARLWCRRYNRNVRSRVPGMTYAGCAVFVHLAQYGSIDQGSLADILAMDPMVLIRVLDRLEEAGFIVRMPDPFDSKINVLALTARALPKIEDIRDLARRTNEEALMGLSKVEADRLPALLWQVRSNLLRLEKKSERSPSIPPRRTGMLN